MTPEALADQLQRALGAALKSVVLYGSAAAGDHIKGESDYNVLVVVEPLGMKELSAVAAVTAAWTWGGNRAPLLFTPEEVAGSADAFSIEWLDIQQSRRVLFGRDPLADLKVSPANLRLQVERETKSQLLRLRESYILTRGRKERVAELLTSSVSTFLVLFRAALRLWQDEVPADKGAALQALARHVGFDPQVFTSIVEVKAGKTKRLPGDALAVFETYLAVIETVVRAVDRRIRNG